MVTDTYRIVCDTILTLFQKELKRSWHVKTLRFDTQEEIYARRGIFSAWPQDGWVDVTERVGTAAGEAVGPAARPGPFSFLTLAPRSEYNPWGPQCAGMRLMD